mmetsp:Transcript_9395/g.17624  ORF Transcript_9395/g.17624 Transcript_9395/m.17624 type:complete len:193 (+) Transcript_9395:1161-1739(+)
MRSMENLGTDCVDCVLIHWPGVARTPGVSEMNASKRAETWKALEDLYKAGKCRAIGVSNYSIAHLQGLIQNCTVRPMVNQVELHPRLSQHELRQACKEMNVAVVAYSPLGTGLLVDNPTVIRISEKLGRTPAQVLLRWGLQKDICVIPKSITKERIVGNSQVFDFEIEESDMAELDELEDDHHFCWNAAHVL